MPIRVEDSLTLHKYRKLKQVPLFKEEPVISKPYIKYNGNNLIKNVKLGPFDRILIGIIDRINPIVSRYPKLSEKIMKLSENMLKRSKNISKALGCCNQKEINSTIK